MRIGAHHRVRVRNRRTINLRREHHARQVFEIHLVADAHPRRDGREVPERRLSPLQKRIPLAVPLKLQQGIRGKRPPGAKLVHLDRVVDDQLRRDQGIDAVRIAAQRLDRVAHRAQVHNRGNPGKVLHQHPRRHVSDLAARLRLRIPGSQKADVAGGHIHSILAAQQVLKQNLQTEGQPAQVEALGRKRRKPVDRIRLVARGKSTPAVKAVQIVGTHWKSLSIRAPADQSRDTNIKPARGRPQSALQERDALCNKGTASAGPINATK